MTMVSNFYPSSKLYECQTLIRIFISNLELETKSITALIKPVYRREFNANLKSITLFSFYKKNFIRTSRLKFGLKIFQKL